MPETAMLPQGLPGDRSRHPDPPSGPRSTGFDGAEAPEQLGVVLVGPGLSRDEPRLLRLRGWAHRTGKRLVDLPQPWFYSHPQANANERRRLGRRDQKELLSLFRSLETRPIAVLVANEDIRGQQGFAWRERLEAAAAAVALQLPRVMALITAEDFDEARLEQRIAHWNATYVRSSPIP
ncbi:MAG: hypothetical protein QM626_07455 [Microbacterium sp.]|uniref:hypothetical protein n=1 Tax=Microbacterium sp. TaxID=51671 RepID=UPI0039E3AE1E